MPQEVHQLTRYLPFIDEAALVEGDEDVAHGLGQALVEGEALAAPVAGGADLLELLLDDVVVLVRDLPGLLDELLAPEVAAVDPLGPELLLDDVLGRDARVVHARHPEGRLAEHAVIADEDVLHGVVEPVAHMEDARDVRGRDYDDEGLFTVAVARGLEGAGIHP